MTVCKPELKQCNAIITFVKKLIPKMKTLHYSQINENAALCFQIKFMR